MKAKPVVPEKPLPTHGGRYIQDADGNHVSAEPVPPVVEPTREE